MSRHVPTVEDYEAALKRFLILVPLVFVFCAVVGFIVGTLVAGKGLIGAGLAQIVLVWAIPALDRFGGLQTKSTKSQNS